jgi:glycine dehydrogenase subunit 2
LVPFLPAPRAVRDGDAYRWDHGDERSIGKLHSFWGNFGILVRAAAYIRALGADGLRDVSESAVLAANYLASRLRAVLPPAYPTQPMHEFVASAKGQKARGARAMDVAKRLIDHGFHPPTVYFPLVVEEAMMIEPTETESLETLDAFVDAIEAVDREIETDVHVLHTAPHTATVSRPDEALAARQLRARWHPPADGVDARAPELEGPAEKPTI